VVGLCFWIFARGLGPAASGTSDMFLMNGFCPSQLRIDIVRLGVRACSNLQSATERGVSEPGRRL
jgi:hypothetical protein